VNVEMSDLGKENMTEIIAFQVEVFMVMTPCSVVKGHQFFGDICWLHAASTEAAWTSERLAFYHSATLRQSPEELSFKHHRRESLRTRKRLQ